MQHNECPFKKAALKNPNYLFLLSPEKNFTYAEFDAYIDQLREVLRVRFPQKVWAIIAKKNASTIALLFAAIREKRIFFPMSDKLPKSEVKKHLKTLSSYHLFETLPSYFPRFSFKQNFSQNLNYDEPLSYLLTSGSSSSPKICVHSLNNHVISALVSNKRLNLKPKDVWLFSLPFYHIAAIAIVFRVICKSACLTIIGDFSQILSQKQKITHISFVWTQLKTHFEIVKKLSHLKVLLMGGGPVNSHLLKRGLACNLPIFTTYGMTELSSQVATSSGKAPLQILPHCEVKINAQSEIKIRSKALALGYLKNNKIIEIRDKEGFFQTKDAGELKDHTLYVKGRLDHQFVSGGENIQPEEIEKVLSQHPRISSCCVVPLPSDLYGCVSVAFVQTQGALDFKEIKSFLRDYLPNYKIPKRFLKLGQFDLKFSRKKLKDSLKNLKLGF